MRAEKVYTLDARFIRDRGVFPPNPVYNGETCKILSESRRSGAVYTHNTRNIIMPTRHPRRRLRADGIATDMRRRDKRGLGKPVKNNYV